MAETRKAITQNSGILKYATGSELPMAFSSQWFNGLGGVTTGGKALPRRSCPAPSLLPPRRSVLHRGGGSGGFHTAGWSAHRGRTCLAPRLSRLRWSALGGCATAGSGWSSCPVWRMWRAVWKETHFGRSTVGTKTEEEEEATFGTQTLGGTRRKYGQTLQVQTGTEGIFH